MTQNIIKVIFVLVSIGTMGCSGKHLITDKNYRTLIEKSFDERQQLADNRKTELFSVFEKPLTVKQTEALKFLIAFMPLNDLADYSGEFFLANADIALQVKNETPWGKSIPEEIFLHYVLPYRLNNENLDSFRIVAHDEIMERIRNKNLKEAALEINHWCHEKVTYQLSDIRTSAPLSTMLSARGRCGEESTFTVAALRTAGIPARQIYTPRWAHCDDNHAWVEIWVDGNWHYMGACEPEPVLDQGWFTEPARRAMLTHTKSFGAFSGNENVINRYRNFAEINDLAKYAVTKRIFVKVLNTDGTPVENAKVEYQLFNYAEFYPLAVVPTNAKGISWLDTGLGDLLIWASKNNNFSFKKITVIETDTLTLNLDKIAESSYNIDMDLITPIVRSPFPLPSPDLVEQNSKKISKENDIRQKYIDSWIKPEEVKEFALKRNMDTSKLVSIIDRSMGNYKEILSFLSDTPDSLIDRAVSLLSVLADKDLRDTKEFILSDHLKNSVCPGDLPKDTKTELFNEYILNPRIDNEMVVGWRSYFKENLPSDVITKASANPSTIVQYLDNNIKIADDENYYKTPLTPKGVNELKVSDTNSRKICFVAICRSLGIPSRLEPGSMIPQYFYKGVWNDVYFSDQLQPSKSKGFIKLVSFEKKPVPEYYHHFTIARFDAGRYNTLKYGEYEKITDFKDELQLVPGHYMVVTGNRLNDSKILANVSFFDLSENEHKTVEIRLRKDTSDVKYLGKIDLNNIVDLFTENKVNPEKKLGNGYVIIWIEPDKEPTKHIFNDLPLLKNELDAWGGYFLFLTTSRDENTGFIEKVKKGLPLNSFFATDDQQNALKKSFGSISSSEIRLPYVAMTDKNGNILFTSSGYRIGIGEQILKSSR